MKKYLQSWRSRPDMEPGFSKPMSASIVGRACFIEDLVNERIKQGVAQYVLLGDGLDTFAERNLKSASDIHIIEIDQPDFWFQ